ncbi:YSIRK-type signal peptide-containing protein [Ligilactobacillus saerimneri]|uniref:YSIRK-type signal peptide-containing protein n=1 Tax=Ligilactobacillus saerimneri TaxID=228229 RepID=A0A7H9EI52_9LACO|nr:YSIRK-type signal peptide-containing protein [Ligilactobacillus saerimneri]QLL77373.1 YSIRK-type signal peptide-containing protein [Ligilactobacillus saerimneri]
MLKNNIFATNHKQRWSIRKLTIGVVSVLFGMTIVFINSTNTVFSDQLDLKTENISKATELISDDNTVKAQNEDSTLTETSDPEETQVNTPENEDAVNVNAAETVSTAKQQNEDDTLKNKTVVQASVPVSVATTKVDTHDKASLTRNQIQAQSSGSQYQPKESDERKAESSKATYYAIFREVTIIKPDGTEVVLPYQVLGSIYFNSDEKENDQLPKLGFKALEAPPIEGYNSPVIPAISVSISDFLNNDITDPTYDDHLYDGHHPIQRQSLDVVGLPDDTKYDDDYDRFSDEFDEKYKDKYGLSDDDFEALLIKEEYFYKKKEDPKPIEGKEEKTITRTINVHLPNGEVQTTKQPVTLERTYTSVAGSDKKEYGPWNTGQWDAFSAPKLDGYTTLLASVDAAEVTSDSLDAVVDIYYRADDPAVVSGKEEKTITRTINVHLPNGEVQTTKQPVTLERTYTSVAGSDEKEYGPWNTGKWDAFTAPERDGYTALLASVDTAEVTSDSLDAVVDIYYRANEPVLPETPTIPIDPTKPINPPTTPGKTIEPPTNPITPGNATIGSESGIISNKVATNSKVTSQNVDNKNAQEKLPQTGDKEITIYSILGLILTSFLGAWLFIRKR